MKVLVLGAGGHAKVVADILISQGVEVVGFLDDNPDLWGSHLLNLPVLGPTRGYQEFSTDALILGIGSNQSRKAIVDRLGPPARSLWISAVHPRSTISRSARIGVGSAVMAGAVINPDASIGDHCVINTGATVDHDCSLADYVHVAPGSHLAGGVRIGEGTLLGIGANVKPYQTLGNWSTIGAGALVIGDVPDNATVVGVPAKVIKQRPTGWHLA